MTVKVLGLRVGFDGKRFDGKPSSCGRRRRSETWFEGRVGLGVSVFLICGFQFLGSRFAPFDLALLLELRLLNCNAKSKTYTVHEHDPEMSMGSGSSKCSWSPLRA